jgi:Metallo-peptidase family M12B Reprolysin-like
MNTSLFMSTAFSIGMSCTVIAMETLPNDPASLLKEQPRNVYHVIKDKTLLDAAKQISIRSGIEFKIGKAIESDVITKKLTSDNWSGALTQFLEGYNYSTVTNKGKIKSVFITGKNGSGKANENFAKSNTRWVAVNSGNTNLPSHYRHYAAGSVMPVQLPMAKIVKTKLGQKVMLDLPMGQYMVNHDDFVDDGNGALTWMGYLENEGKGYRVFLSQGEAGIMGNISTPDGTYALETVDGRLFLVDEERAGLNFGGYENDQAIHKHSSILDLSKPDVISPGAALLSAGNQPETMAAPELISAVNTPSSLVTATAGSPIVDVMVLYTTVKQTATYAKQRIKYLINISNRAYQDSFINMRLRLVHTRSTNYVERGSNNTALGDLASSRGAFSGVAALRNQYGADLVLLLRPYYASASSNCGIAYVGFSSGSGANSGSAFGAISDGTSREAPTNYYCGISTFTHEVGHNLGNVHDRAFSGFSGKFPYSYAWGINNKFGTIMSYYGPSLMLFATPKLPTQCVGLPCGYAEGSPNSSDQSRTTNFTAPFVANYRATKITTPVIQ